jgi:hypothetical protein
VLREALEPLGRQEVARAIMERHKLDAGEVKALRAPVFYGSLTPLVLGVAPRYGAG